MNAGPSDRAGFIDAPEMGPAKMASSAIIDPMITAGPSIFARDLFAIINIAKTKMNVKRISRVKD